MDGKEERLRQMMEQYGDGILRMCALYLGDAALAQDMAQETFLKAYRHMDTFRGESSEKTWLTRIAINLCKDELRRPWRRHVDGTKPVEDVLTAATDGPSPEDDTVLRAVMALRPKEREAILLRYYQQLKLEEMSRVLNVPKGTVTSRLNRAKRGLRKRLERWYFDE